MKNTYYLLFALFFAFLLASCSAKQSKSVSTSSHETAQKEKVEDQRAEEATRIKEIFIPEEEFEYNRSVVEGQISESEGKEKLSISNAHAQVNIFAPKIKEGSYQIGATEMPYATVNVNILSSDNKIVGALEAGEVEIIYIDSLVAKGHFEGYITKDNERYFLGGKFGN